ncbi:hypothetical protein ABN034_10970 [Actinopolymorpha sp. B11F2]|uniref:hypothetical protein n=1 Tax=Actinopolymorpha sp. B11F2 TaxID=3160862 RepID=UPI0032E42010
MTDSLQLERGERVLATSRDTAERWVVGTDRTLFLPTAEGAYDRIPWEQVEHAEWDRDTEVLRVTGTAPLGERLPVWTVSFAEPGSRLLSLIRERITASVVVDQRVSLRGPLGVRVIARRPPAKLADLGMAGEPATELSGAAGQPGTAGEPGTGGMVWALAFDEGLDPADPEILAAAERVLDGVRAEVEP